MAIELVCFTPQCRISGALPLADDRLTDMLNAVTRIVVRQGTLEDLDSGRLQSGDLSVDASQLVAVVATGSPGLAARRKRTNTYPSRVHLGRYEVAGLLHQPAGEPEPPLAGRPAEVLAGRDVLVPLTEATISYERRGERVVERHGTILVNRAVAVWIDPGELAQDNRPVRFRAAR